MKKFSVFYKDAKKTVWLTKVEATDEKHAIEIINENNPNSKILAIRVIH